MTHKNGASSTEKLLGLIRTRNDKSSNSRTDLSGLKSLNRRSGILNSISFLPHRNKDILGVDLSGKTVKMVLATRTGHDWSLKDARVVDLDMVRDPSDPGFISAFKKILDDFCGNASKVDVWSMVSSSRAEVWSIKVPMVRKGLANAVYWTARKDKSFDEKQNIFDYRISGLTSESDVRKYLISAYTVQNEEKDFFENIFNRAGYSLKGLTVSTFAFQNLFNINAVSPDESNLAILYIDHESTRIDIFQDKSLRLSRVIKTGLDSILETIMFESASDSEIESLQIEGAEGQDSGEKIRPEDLDRACRLLDATYQDSHESDNPECREIFEMMIPVLRRLALQVERTLDHYVNVLGNQPVQRLYLAGKPSAISGLRSFMEEQLTVDVQRLDPMHPSLPFNTSRITIDRTSRLELAPAAGIALSDNAHTPNLLFTARDHEKKRIADLVSKFTAAACMLLVLAFAGYSWMEKHKLSILAQEEQALQEQLSSFKPVLTRNQLLELSGDLKDQNAILRDVIKRNMPLGILQELARLTPEHIRLLNLVFNPDKDASDPVSGGLIVQGIIISDSDMFDTYLSSYVYSLRGSLLFADSSVGNTYTETLFGQGEVFRFVLNINLQGTE